MPSLKLTGEQYQSLTDALINAFPTLPQLTQMVRFKLGRNLAEFSLGDSLSQIAFQLVQFAEARGFSAELLAGAREANPANASLVALAQELDMGAAKPVFERMLRQASPMFDPVKFRERLGEIESQVCRIEIAVPSGTIYGTGCLLGPNVVMTNYHVMEPVIQGTVAPTVPLFRFDHKVVGNQPINPGTTFGLALAPEDWLIDASPPSAIDELAEPKPGTPRPDELDYAIVRLDGSPGSKPVGPNSPPGSPPRKWIALTSGAHRIKPKMPLLILQHPATAPLKLALEMEGVIELNANKTRVKHKVNTESGSSGAPCFDSNWELIALHHTGDPNFDKAHKPTYNQGIPIDAILALLAQRGKQQQAIGPWT